MCTHEAGCLREPQRRRREQIAPHKAAGVSRPGGKMKEIKCIKQWRKGDAVISDSQKLEEEMLEQEKCGKKGGHPILLLKQITL